LLRHSKSHNGGGSGVHSSANLTTGDLDGDKGEEPSPISTSGTNFYSPSISPNFHGDAGSYDSHTCGAGDHGSGGTGNFNSPSGLLSDPARHHDPMSMQSVDPTLEISPQNIPQGTLPGLHTSPPFVDPSLDDASPHHPNPTPFVTDADGMQINLVSTVSPGFDSGDQWAQALFAEPSWLIGQGFDFGALNASIIPGFPDINTNHYVDGDAVSSVLPPPAVTALQESQNQIAVEYKPLKTNVARLWFTSMDPSEENDEPSRPGSSSLMSPDREMTDAGDENSGVFDEQYRRRLSNQMKPKWAEEPLPSVDFLVRFPPDLSGQKLICDRTCACKCILPSVAPSCRFCTARRSNRRPRIHFCCLRYAPLEVCSLGLRVHGSEVSGFLKELIRLFLHQYVPLPFRQISSRADLSIVGKKARTRSWGRTSLDTIFTHRADVWVTLGSKFPTIHVIWPF